MKLKEVIKKRKHKLSEINEIIIENILTVAYNKGVEEGFNLAKSTSPSSTQATGSKGDVEVGEGVGRRKR